jgi:hypothetical protein
MGVAPNRTVSSTRKSPGRAVADRGDALIRIIETGFSNCAAYV